MLMAQYATLNDLCFAIDPEGWANVMTMRNQVDGLVSDWNGLVAVSYTHLCIQFYKRPGILVCLVRNPKFHESANKYINYDSNHTSRKRRLPCSR